MIFRCLGITGKWGRCLRDGQPLYCPEHRPQPYIALASTIFGFLLAVVGSLVSTHISNLASETELKPSDFDIELVSSRHGGKKPFSFVPSELLHVSVVIGSILIDATLALESRGESAYTGGRNPWQNWYYPSKRLNLTMDKRVTLESLVGQRVLVNLPVRVLHPESVNELRIWIHGKQVTLRQKESAKINYVLTKKDIEVSD